MQIGYDFKPGDTGIAECTTCGEKVFHVYCQSGHKCQSCGGTLNCGMMACKDKDKPANMSVEQK